MKKLLAVLATLSLLTILVAACGGGSGSSGGGGGTGTDAHMGNATFTQPSVTISKGSSLNLIDDVAVTHIIANGSWDNGTAKPATESGAPTVSNVMFSSAGQSQAVGPFTTAGTFHLYCSIHPGMNLTVTVQ